MPFSLSSPPHSIYMSVACAAWWRCVAMKVICSVTVRPFYQLLFSSILVSEYWWQWNQGAVKTFCKLLCQWRGCGFRVVTVLFHSPVKEVQHLCPFSVGLGETMQPFQTFMQVNCFSARCLLNYSSVWLYSRLGSIWNSSVECPLHSE